MDQLAAFRQSLADTIVWCSARATTADPEWSLRTPALQPGHLDADLSFIERQACVSAVIQSRSRLLHDVGLYSLKSTTDLAGGRLLLFDPDGTLSDGAATNSSQQFFDYDNVPPWDCWVLYVADPLSPEQQAAERARGRQLGRWSSIPPIARKEWARMSPPYYAVDPLSPWRDSYLVCWIAPPLIPLAHTGIVVNPESCIEWLADRDTPFTRSLSEVHLLV